MTMGIGNIESEPLSAVSSARARLFSFDTTLRETTHLRRICTSSPKSAIESTTMNCVPKPLKT